MVKRKINKNNNYKFGKTLCLLPTFHLTLSIEWSYNSVTTKGNYFCLRYYQKLNKTNLAYYRVNLFSKKIKVSRLFINQTYVRHRIKIMSRKLRETRNDLTPFTNMLGRQLLNAIWECLVESNLQSGIPKAKDCK